jgi:hypothetical protein
MGVSLGGFENSADGGELTGPFASFVFQGFFASVGEDVVFGAAIVFGGAPFAVDPAGALEAEERGAEGAGVDLEDAFTDLIDADGDAVAVHGFERESFEDEHVESSLDDGGGFIGHGERSSSGSRGRIQGCSRLSRGEMDWN